MTSEIDHNRVAEVRYLRRVIPAVIGFLACSFGLELAQGTTLVNGIPTYGLALIPVGLLLFVFWAFQRFLSEVDEFIRSVHRQGVWFGLAIILIVSTSWGFFERYADVTALPIFWLTPIFWISYGLATGLLSKRAGLPI